MRGWWVPGVPAAPGPAEHEGGLGLQHVWTGRPLTHHPVSVLVKLI